MYSLMNHELIHEVQGDIANDQDRRWRKLFLGKVAPQEQKSRIPALQLSHGPSSHDAAMVLGRQRGIFETWMAGGLGRAQGGYDEMMFRAMVRDEAPFYDPLGLESKGPKNQFQGLGKCVLVRRTLCDMARV